MDYISEYINKKKQNKKITESLPIENRDFWLDFLNDSDRAEASKDRQNRRTTVSLDFEVRNDKKDTSTAVIDLFIDDSPTALETIIHREENDFITSLLPKLSLILDELDEVDKNIILLYFKNEKIPSYRSMGRQLNMDYRKIQRRIPHIMKYIEDRLKK